MLTLSEITRRAAAQQQLSAGHHRAPPIVEVDFDADTPPVLQRANWTCSAATLAWMLTSIGYPTSENEAVGLLIGRITPELGLLDRSGVALVHVCKQLGLGAYAWLNVTFDDVRSLAGLTPVGIGGQRWYHWSAVRGYAGDELLLANPAPLWRGVGQQMSRAEFATWGPFNAVVIDRW